MNAQRIKLFFKLYAPSVLRYGMGTVILWFSIEQFLHNSLWTAYVPDYAVAISHLSASTLVFFNAAFELVMGILLVFGWRTRIVALLLALHLFDIMWTVGYGEIGARDFGLAVATLVIAMNGPDILCIKQGKNSVMNANYANNGNDAANARNSNTYNNTWSNRNLN
ncbi:DoxX family membrane protein [Patescibacteria group bacterium]|nr:DoxX family membrane protein [Patescibacteria group bacterium]MDE1946950.1 DoxX family membrane protein [Patescibacteria group bacterium]MDE2011211.1 DoxX family membrane protein [Patescibacteria group bacterium]MDE2233501.1 DoxX family membrane protein [Patescibacteria group bacterium]